MAEGLKHDNEKPRWDLLPYDAVEEVVKVLTYGANKYEARNWERGIEYSRLFAAAQRHMVAWMKGEDIDPESNRHHLAHAVCELLFILAFEQRGQTYLNDIPRTIPVNAQTEAE